MLYDLNISWSPSTKIADLEKILRFSSSLGYDVVAINHTIGAPIPSQIVNSIPQLTPPPKSHPQPQSSNTPSPSSSLPATLRRVTVLVADPATNHRLPALAAAYDILAVRPTTEKGFQAACTSITEASLISLDLTAFFPFHFRPKPVMAAVNRGVRFEICYAQALTGDARARANFIANTISLVRASKGRGLVVSSEARAPLSVRAPADVINLMAVWGLATERGTEALGVNPRGVVVNEGIKRRGFRGVIDIVETPGKDANDTSGERTDEGNAGEGKDTTRKDKVSGADKNQVPVIGSKRKDKADGGDDTGKSPQQTMSKRQAKKMRIASMNAASQS
ncbi:putative rnase p subunit p30 protein [Phaeoacremonium minimum UCRPA7]|uniref:Putative rnase p subunit p30 protein n=1 Tax=Phaeoacremonium minimum (strain UCR-PA7) TaxID=1286976 RepID=R8BM81_PHAM7|nr:putative rnase p subunit p30 protein [Phaeoacremonium minimum UCRPA7]EOO00488.1 putative rnase p subunit p30 protein [Phaeoacremonium minimum UCRPA7]